jgi:hypothetical protein
MRRLFCGAVIPVLCAGAAAGDADPNPEAVLVEGGALDGVWSILIPSEMGTDFRSAHFGPLTKKLCRFEGKKDHITVRCFGPYYYAREGTAEIDASSVHLAWGSALARFVIDATLDTPFHFKGTFSFKVMGIRYDDSEAITGKKIQFPKAVVDDAGKEALLTQSLQQLSDGALVAPHDDAAMKKNLGDAKAVTADELRVLGAIQTVRYVGKTARAANGKFPDFFSVYQVEFASGERLCGLHQRANGVLDALICV